MDITTMRIVATLASFATFIGIVAWAWARRNRARFDEAARIVFEEEMRPHAQLRSLPPEGARTSLEAARREVRP